jgi:DNA-binding transcriptional MerR regulator
MYTVGEVSGVTGVSVRTLHHYDEIGLLRPAERSGAGYRQYDDGDLGRLQEILFYRELGFGLDAIGGLVDTPAQGRRDVLRRQRQLIAGRIERLWEILGAVDGALRAHEEGRTMNREEMFEVFGDFEPAEHEEEAKKRWGNTDAFAESGKRTARYNKDDWKRMGEEAEVVNQRLADLFGAGLAPSAADAMAAAEEHRLHIDRWFYPCPYEIHCGLGEMYAVDPRFTKFWDAHQPGLADFVRDAFRANAERAK